MPELPEVETVARGLAKSLMGDRIVSVDVLRKDSIGYPSPREFAKRLKGHRFESVNRRGKYILAGLDNNAGFACHLRMSGRLLVASESGDENNFLRVRMGLESGRELRFEDMRVFGRLWYISKNEAFETIIPTLAELGPEPLPELHAEFLQAAMAGKKQTIKSALLDQRILAGLGNIYVDESLFLSGINPALAAGQLKLDAFDRLACQITKVLTQAIELGGTTLRDYTDVSGTNGNYQHEAWVYGRTGKSCRVCNEKIERIKIGGRSSHFCPKCQPLKKARSAAIKKPQQ